MSRALALGGLVGPILFSTLVVVCGALRPEYNHATQFISELGETGGGHASLMNFVGFIPAGLLLTAFGASLAALLPRTVLSIAGALLIATFGFGIAAAGLYSCDPGCSRQTMSSAATVHDVVSRMAFLSGILGTAIWGYRFRNVPSGRSIWRYTVGSSVVALALLLMLIASAESRASTGIWQRLFLATLFLWCSVVGVRVFRRPAASSRDAV